MLNNNSDKTWEYFGKNDPYFGVITCQDYQQQNLDENTKNNFFASGEVHINSVLSTVKKHLDSEFIPQKALDFGCGVGRLVIPLASICDFVLGVDVSESMLQEAENNCNSRGISNVEFLKSDDYLSNISEKFDFIHSFIVFQHIPSHRGERIFRKLIELLQEGGVGVLHFTYLFNRSRTKKIVYWARKSIPFFNGLINLMRQQKFNYPMMEINEYDLGKLFQILQENNCHNCYVMFTEHSYPGSNIYGAMIFFQKKTVE